ncbi:Cas1p-domain-containing protein [Lepidopterella palustris CBS 459.81]|uniref:Cas1p-domain-containing protein n=1 Tax=Lepidopterella palustris CBS 459.81 TaxID=1314670 RepID=A0A8E2EHT1_9PEZI|nr:Cas1p-domain-containing protein [Lepidopterella palustris CBS 459.81]
MPRIRFPRISSPAEAFNRSSYILILIVLVATICRYANLDAQDPYKCGALLRDGQWLDSPDFGYPQRPFQNWQAPGCILHEYNGPEIARCAGKGKILFVGDSTVRQIFWAMAKKIDPYYVEYERAKPDEHVDIMFARGGVTLKFLWDPFLNSSSLFEELRAYRKVVDPLTVSEKPVGGQGSGSGTGNQRSTIIFIGGGLWHARHIQVGALKHFKDAVDNIAYAAYSSATTGGVRTLPLSGEDGIGDRILFGPVLEPLYDTLSPARAATIVPEKINEMNQYLEQLSTRQGLNVLWSYSNMTSKRHREAYGESGIHVIANVASRMADVVLNLRCNAKAAHQDGYPYNRTCCNDYRPFNWIQVFVLLCSLVGFPVLAIRAVRARKRSRSNESGSITFALFNKVRKQYTNSDFAIFSSIALVLGILSTRGPVYSPSRRRCESGLGTSVRQSFLSRSQTDEWKGWMQFFILTYHYTGASNQLWIYEIIRILIASYLFLTGYCHTMYFMEEKDYSFRRIASVLIRLNLLASLLPFAMRTTYAFYYFAPLVSFWFLVVWVTMRIHRNRNEYLPFLLGKIITSAIAVTAFIQLKGILEFIFLILRMACGITGNSHELRYQLGLDAYVVYAGMFVAILHIRVWSILSLPQLHPTLLTEMISRYFALFRAFFVFAAAIVIPVFWIVTRRSQDTHDYDWWQPYIAWLPIVSFVVLRNSTRFLRSHHSSVFAWLGRHSLETYTLQYHIWLAGDGGGLLSTGLFQGDGTIKHDRWRDFALITPIFIWMSWRVAGATTTITNWIIKGEDTCEKLPEMSMR